MKMETKMKYKKVAYLVGKKEKVGDVPSGALLPKNHWKEVFLN